MKISDMFQEVYLGISSNKIRSGLTMLGIVIGIASVIAMLSIGGGAKAQIENNIQAIGSNLLMVMPGAQRGIGASVNAGRGTAQTLTIEDSEALKNAPGVDSVAPESSQRYQITVAGKNTNTQTIGTTPAYMNVRNVSVELGSFFTDTQVASRSKVAVIGPTTLIDLFGEGANPVGQRIRIKGMEFTIVGVTAAKGGSGFSNSDDVVIVPISTMSTFLSGSKNISTIGIKAVDQESMTLAQEEITALLLARHNIPSPDNADFSVLNQSDLVDAVSSVTDTFTALLASIAGISLLVGGIGIMNMMLTTVTERTREIGLRQAIGAERIEIISQFLGEAVLLTLMGGFLGIVMGYGISRVISSLMQTPTVVSWSSITLAFGVSAAIGLIFGFYPARQAAQLNPIQALRYE
ncbi:MAG: ABC transporter permease [Patescibacteria group bacterium]|nr:ABC transporter permease [Patescibacteria group bacterium]